MATEEYLTFNQTLEKLGIGEDELLNLVSGSQLRAFRIDRETKFRREDVEALGKQGGTVLAAQESAVLDFDDLPNDVTLVEEEPAPAPADNSGDALDLEMAPAEDALEIVEPTLDSNPELEETVMTDSSQVAHTEELSVDDDNFDFSTQEVTIHEDAISEEEVAGSQTAVDETLPVEEPTQAAPAHHTRGMHHQSHAYSSAISNRRHMYEKPSNPAKTDLLWTGVLAALVLVMIYPALMLGTVLFYGFTTGSEVIAPGEQNYSGQPNSISTIWVPKAFSWVQDPKVTGAFGSATYYNGQLKGAVSFEERLRMNMIKFDKPGADAGEKKE